jgi:type I restriction enzyme S subunit
VSVPAYRDYKDSGVAWLGAVPSHWIRKPLFALVRELDDRNDGMKEDNLLSLSYGQIKRKNIDDNDGLLPASFETYQIVERNDIIWRLTDLQNDQRSLRSGIVCERGIITAAYLATRPTGIHPEFLAFLLRAYDLTKVFYSMGGGLRQSMKYSDVKWLPIMLPSDEEQAAITAFLDRETAKIDALVSEQQRLIALLNEKRQAVISLAVTKGLNPDAPMKDSGIEWLGQIPAHWEVGPVKRYFEFMDGKRIPLSAEERGGMQGEYPYYGASGIIDYVDNFIFDEPLVLVSEDGANLLMRNYRIAFVARGQYWVNNHAHILKPLDGLVTFWADRIEAIELTPIITGSAQPKLTADALEKLSLAVPPTLEERSKIEAYVADATAKFAPLMDEAQSAITLLQQRRAALIYAAVTGKIDVRARVQTSNVVPIESARVAKPLPSIRAVVGSYVILQLGSMGRMAVMKGGYLAEAHCGINDIGGRYERFAAGPYDSSVIVAMERGANELCGIKAMEPVKAGDAVRYQIPQAARPPQTALKALIGDDRTTAFTKLLTDLSGVGRDGVEAVATLYAVWNDLLAAGKAADDDAIFTGFLTEWSDEKPKRFNRNDLIHWIGWMRRHGIMPNGTAPRTDHQGGLFS